MRRRHRRARWGPCGSMRLFCVRAGSGEEGRGGARTESRSSHKKQRAHTHTNAPTAHHTNATNRRRRRRRRRGCRGRRAAALPAAAAVPPRRGRGAAEGPAARARAAAGGEGARRERGGREERAGALPAALWRALRARPPLSLAHSASKTRPKTHPEKHNPNCQTHNTRQTNTNRQVAWESAEDIASEVLALVRAAAPHIRAQWAWAGALNLLKMTSVKREAFPISLEVRGGRWGSARQAVGRSRSGAARRPARRRQRVDRVRPRHPKTPPSKTKHMMCACKKNNAPKPAGALLRRPPRAHAAQLRARRRGLVLVRRARRRGARRRRARGGARAAAGAQPLARGVGGGARGCAAACARALAVCGFASALFASRRGVPAVRTQSLLLFCCCADQTLCWIAKQTSP